ncbi:hypothetical protein ACPRNU_14125 [Chromobacterium vaccinii]|uniref:hypothetical protein n=1 Tax=Chromobacterium vaccinii TaxID=1108595 RepID=UPI003C75A84C
MNKYGLISILALSALISACGNSSSNKLACSSKEFEIVGAAVEEHFYGTEYVIYTLNGDRSISDRAGMRQDVYQAILAKKGTKQSLLVYPPLNVKGSTDMVIDLDDNSARSKYRKAEICGK